MLRHSMETSDYENDNISWMHRLHTPSTAAVESVSERNAICCGMTHHEEQDHAPARGTSCEKAVLRGSSETVVLTARTQTAPLAPRSALERD